MTSTMVANNKAPASSQRKQETPEQKLARQNARNAKIAAYTLDLKKSIIQATPEFITLVEQGAFKGIRCKTLKHIPTLHAHYIGTHNKKDYTLDREGNKYEVVDHQIENSTPGEYRQWVQLKADDDNLYYDAEKNKFYYCNFLSSKKIMFIELPLYEQVFKYPAYRMPQFHAGDDDGLRTYYVVRQSNQYGQRPTTRKAA